MDLISLVSGDGVANLQITLIRDDSGLTYNAGGADIALHLRKKGSTIALTTVEFDSGLSGAGDGTIIFALGDFLLTNPEEGYYEGEIEITFADGTTQTIFQTLNFRIRNGFA